MASWHNWIMVMMGTVTGFITALATGGGNIVIPYLILAGLTSTKANATYRVVLMVTSLVTAINFHRAGKIDWRYMFSEIIPLGSVAGLLGIWMASVLDEHTLGMVIIASIASFLVISLFKLGGIAGLPDDTTPEMTGKNRLYLFLGCFWCGLLAPMYLILALVCGMGYDVIRANAIKTVMLLFITSASLFVFAEHHDIDWNTGWILAGGGLLGAFIGGFFVTQDWLKTWTFRGLLVLIAFDIYNLLAKYKVIAALHF